jgi:hypothetical protein
MTRNIFVLGEPPLILNDKAFGSFFKCAIKVGNNRSKIQYWNENLNIKSGGSVKSISQDHIPLKRESWYRSLFL